MLINLTSRPRPHFIPTLQHPHTPPQPTSIQTPQQPFKPIAHLLPQISTLDSRSLNIPHPIYLTPPSCLPKQPQILKHPPLKPHLQSFHTPHLSFPKQIIQQPLIHPHPIFQFSLPIPSPPHNHPQTIQY
ncbi:3-keto-5-aminohexanoate cleavage protein, partial [Staphylococcus epidermidis]|uniref:3-keto-5-aminohexanoate cleavage protein n=1 Tax=Staphylococcus epidermidis TaxID=1282 RepID=UPI0037D9A7EB